jgi:hypothetical protein
MRKKSILAICLIVPLLVACNTNTIPAPSSYVDGTWAGLFKGYWSSMNSNYIFWDLDSPTREWDTAYEQYIGKFEALGTIDYSDTETTKKALRYFYDISKNLSDGHYRFGLVGMDEKSYFFTPNAGRLAKELDPTLTDDDLFSYICTNGHLDLKKQFPETEAAENFTSIMQNTFQVDPTAYGSVVYSWDHEEGTDFDTLDRYFSRWVLFPPSYDDTSSSPGMLMGVTKENTALSIPSNCFYFLLEEFGVTGVKGENRDRIVSSFYEFFGREGLKGFVLDLRGNPGGYAEDLPLLFSKFSNKDIPFLRYRSKEGSNRLDYGPWRTTTLPTSLASTDDPSPLMEKPIAVITNSMSVSCAEMTTLLFKSFPKGKSVGNHTRGGEGILVDNSSTTYAGGGFVLYQNSKRILNVYTPFIENVPLNSESFEGKGIPADIPIVFNYADFTNHIDARLNAAFKYVNDNQ